MTKQQEINLAWEEHEKWEIQSREDSIKSMERDWQIERIANEARTRKVEMKSIYRFFRSYNLSTMDIIKFWNVYKFHVHFEYDVLIEVY